MTGCAIQHVEDNKNCEAAKSGGILLKSRNDNLGLWQTVWTFRRAVLVCNLLCIAAAADGYQINLNGNIIANDGFTNKLGFLNDEGKMTLDANHTALWGAMQSLGQLLGMILLNPISDRIGRKMTLYALWLGLEMEPQDPRTTPPRPSEGRFLVTKFRPAGRFKGKENRPSRLRVDPEGLQT
ncbi:hypothetical protein BJX63DRAFT_438303 [Aspergillus granulosus]|uniref:Major facilitator superfamily (MFS) profile domain-containing protein n=1 Tax=Aspergillus granulosus TaxID=176169 RepID=A0ABR4GSY0_9EURO